MLEDITNTISAPEKKVAMLPVAGATIYYEVRGQGSVLLLIPAGGGDASSYEDVATYLAAWYTVLTYDRRGYSHSKLTNPDETPTVESHGDDAHYLLAEVSPTAPAYVFGSSAGGVVALDLLTRYPTQIHTMVAHEPAKLVSANPEHDKVPNLKEIVEQGGLEALQKYIGVDFNARKSVVAGDGGQRAANMKFFIENEPQAIGRYKYNLAALRAATTQVRLVIGGSTTAQDAIGYRSATMAANFFATKIVEFPGDHAGYMSYPQENAEILHKVFEGKL
jgi:pimeloyl-ACP methyl ester carboxylesterase